MALPAGITPKTVTFGLGTFTNGDLVEGTVTITAPVNVLHVPTGSPIFSSTMSQKIVNGQATFDLCPTDHPDLNRRDWTYTLVVKINGALKQPDPMPFLLPIAGPDTVDLDSLVSVPSSAGTPVSVTVLTAQDLDPLTAGYVGDTDSATSGAVRDLVAADTADPTSAIGVAQRAAFDAEVNDGDFTPTGAWDWTGAAVTGLSGGGSGLPLATTVVTASGGDDTAAVQAALDAGDVLLAATGGDFHLGQITYEGSTSRRIFALEPVRIIQTAATGVFDLRGGWDALGTVSSYATIASDLVTPGESNPTTSRTDVSVLTLAAAATIAVGDVLKIVADDQVPTGRTANARIGEYALAGVASTGTTVVLDSRLIENYVTNIRLARLWDVQFQIAGPITFDTDPAIRDTTVFGAVVLVRAARDCYIGGRVRFRNSLGRAIGNYTFGAEFTSIDFRNLANRPSLSQYGYGIQDGGWAARVDSCYGENLRHLYSEGWQDTTAGDTHYEYFGGGWFATVSNCVGVNCQAQAFDTHGTSYGISFIGCKAVGAFQGAGSGGYGIAVRGRNHFLSGCSVQDSWAGISVSAAGTTVEGCTVRRARYQALSILGDTSDAVNVTTITGIRIIGGTYETETGNATAQIGAQGYNITADLVGVGFRQTVGTNGGRFIQVTGATTLKYRDLTFDASAITVAGTTYTFYLTGTSAISLRGVGITVFGGSAPITGYHFINGDANAPALAAVRLDGIRYEHASVSPTGIGGSGWVDCRISWRGTFGTSWFQHDVGSHNPAVTVAANTVLTAIGQALDQDIVCQLNGSAGAVTIAALPAGLNGQRLTLWNASNGDVTIPSLNTVPAGTGKSYVNTGAAWRAL